MPEPGGANGHVAFVVVVNYKSHAISRRCVDSVLRSTVPTRVIIIDNSVDECEADVLFSTFAGEQRVQVHVSPDGNVGFGAACNHGARIAQESQNCTGDSTLVFLNPDVVVPEGALEQLIARSATPDDEIFSPVIVNGGGSSPLQTWFAGGDLDFRRGRSGHIGIGESVAVEGYRCTVQSSRPDSSFLSGATMLMSFSTWNRIGGFREDLFLYWEDADLSIRASEMGVPLRLIDDVYVWHEVGGTMNPTHVGERSENYFYYMQRNRLIVLGPRRGLIGLLLGAGAGETLRLTLRPLRQRNRRYAKVAASLRGVKDGIFAARTGNRSL